MTDAPCCHEDEPPDTAGAFGAVRSIIAEACTQPELLLAPSRAWNRTRVVPWAVIVAALPKVGADQVEPPLVEV